MFHVPVTVNIHPEFTVNDGRFWHMTLFRYIIITFKLKLTDEPTAFHIQVSAQTDKSFDYKIYKLNEI